jgi:copper chaperone CopZ
LSSCCATSTDREKASPPQICPECERKGRGVEPITLKALLRPGALARLENVAYSFCPAPTCPVVYFANEVGSVYSKADLKVRVGLKEADDPIPICYCFGHSRASAWEEIQRTGHSTLVASITAHVKAGRCACEVNNPSGTCCLGEVNKTVKEGLAQLGTRAEAPTAVTMHDRCAEEPRGPTRLPLTDPRSLPVLGPRAPLMGDRQRRLGMREKLSAAGAVLVAILASSCCWGPLLLAGLGTGAGGFASALGPYRPYLMALTFIFLAGAWYLTLRKRAAVAAASAEADGTPGDACCAQEACCAPGGERRRNVLLLAGVTAFALAMLVFPQISSVVARNRSRTRAVVASTGPVESATLAIKGMSCEACEGHIREALLKVPGVLAAKVDYRKASARVTFQQGKVSTGQLKQEVARTGYAVTTVTQEAPSLPASGKPPAGSAG